ncbi:hypothetical protein SESBI_25156 [Sesbania bispinosa]|nr:hypothetical protein SESBI_25156 [Sesbania bispinosa]
MLAARVCGFFALLVATMASGGGDFFACPRVPYLAFGVWRFAEMECKSDFTLFSIATG